MFDENKVYFNIIRKIMFEIPIRLEGILNNKLEIFFKGD